MEEGHPLAAVDRTLCRTHLVAADNAWAAWGGQDVVVGGSMASMGSDEEVECASGLVAPKIDNTEEVCCNPVADLEFAHSLESSWDRE
jgi:hypothetical protein